MKSRRDRIRTRHLSHDTRPFSFFPMTATAEPDDATPLSGEAHKPDFLGHPRGLWYLAFTEAWERFSYYGMQSLLVLYMVKYLLVPGRIEHVAAFAGFRKLYGGLDGQALASAIFGTYAAAVYLTPIFGGLLADRLLGRRRTVLLGALIARSAASSRNGRPRTSGFSTPPSLSAQAFAS
jgi:MFS family permease